MILVWRTHLATGTKILELMVMERHHKLARSVYNKLLRERKEKGQRVGNLWTPHMEESMSPPKYSDGWTAGVKKNWTVKEWDAHLNAELQKYFTKK